MDKILIIKGKKSHRIPVKVSTGRHPIAYINQKAICQVRISTSKPTTCTPHIIYYTCTFCIKQHFYTNWTKHNKTHHPNLLPILPDKQAWLTYVLYELKYGGVQNKSPDDVDSDDVSDDDDDDNNNNDEDEDECFVETDAVNDNDNVNVKDKNNESDSDDEDNVVSVNEIEIGSSSLGEENEEEYVGLVNVWEPDFEREEPLLENVPINIRQQILLDLKEEIGGEEIMDKYVKRLNCMLGKNKRYRLTLGGYLKREKNEQGERIYSNDERKMIFKIGCLFVGTRPNVSKTQKFTDKRLFFDIKNYIDFFSKIRDGGKPLASMCSQALYPIIKYLEQYLCYPTLATVKFYLRSKNV